ncbi:YcjX family protein [Cognatishimia sp. F0-27]|uniref:YcjX family protein n=1 Tax=Cognatishimia sp. F0-27 TaxID=2816855 RepID=UPI001D0C5175|nr:YcjX family protein [Cognatishimia sp. F0-27]MCC1491949.1 YcjX family protein [Cognatishimia sp. F0-27]
MVIGTIADTLTRSVENVTGALSETFVEPTIRLGVTGLSRAGKTVFITSLIANLMDRGRMPQLLAESENRILTAFLQPQPDDTIPRFDYEAHLAALSAREPRWPDSTRAISELRLSMKIRPNGLLAGLQGPRVIHLDIVDYPGEWLLDLGLLDKSYTDWSRDMLERLALRPDGPDFIAMAQAEDATQPIDETRAKGLAAQYTAALDAAREAGFSDCSPGRFLLPGDLAGSPVLTFAPLPPLDNAPRRSLWREMERRFEAYKARVVKPFFRDHFSRIDRQVVLVDALGAIHAGPRAVEDLRQTMADILGAFRPGANAFLSKLLLGKRVEKILFAATKADHLHHTQHPRLAAIMDALMRDARDRARFAGAETQALALAAYRATTEERMTHEGRTLDVVRGTLLGSGKQAAFYPGELPEDPAHLLTPARNGAERWLDADYQVMRFAPARLSRKPGEGPPHIRLDRAAQFLIGDRL